MFRLTRHGWREMLIGSVVLVVSAVALGVEYSWWFSLICLPVLIWLLAFFRDPERQIPAEQHIMVSPADGKVSDITSLDSDPLLDGPAVRVGIFLSVFNVHVNRSPCDARVLSVQKKEGRFRNALNHQAASDENAANTIVLVDQTSGRPIAVVKQIVGAIARRIVCTARPGHTVRRGDRIGMIKFGSRTELYIPQWLQPQILVHEGDAVYGASTVIARLGTPIHTVLRKVDEEEFEKLVPRQTPA